MQGVISTRVVNVREVLPAITTRKSRGTLINGEGSTVEKIVCPLSYSELCTPSL